MTTKTPDYGTKTVTEEKPISFPPQHQDQPGMEYKMDPKPVYDNPEYKAAGKLEGKVALITGGDSGIGRAVAVAYAKEGAKVAIAYVDGEEKDAQQTKEDVERYGSTCLVLEGDLREEENCIQIVEDTVNKFGQLDILVNNCGEQHYYKSLEDIDSQTMRDTFATNIFSYIYTTKAALKHLKEGASVINTSSIVAFGGSPNLIDYSSTKGAITTFTRSAADNLAEKGIRVNAIAPGTFWTALQPASQPGEVLEQFGQASLMKRAGQPYEIAPAYVYLACDDSSYVTGETMHINGGEWISG